MRHITITGIRHEKEKDTYWTPIYKRLVVSTSECTRWRRRRRIIKVSRLYRGNRRKEMYQSFIRLSVCQNRLLAHSVRLHLPAPHFNFKRENGHFKDFSALDFDVDEEKCKFSIFILWKMVCGSCAFAVEIDIFASIFAFVWNSVYVVQTGKKITSDIAVRTLASISEHMCLHARANRVYRNKEEMRGWIWILL